jgi:Tfp pilus assembly protein PilF
VWTQEAVRYLGQAIASDPSYTLPYVTLARVYIREKEYSQARKLLESCLAVQNPTVPAEFENYDRLEAQKWLRIIEGK